MRLAVVHYHLRRGGVTRVIDSALAAVGHSIEKAVVLASTEPEEPLGSPVAVVPELAYCTGASETSADALQLALEEAAARHLGGPPDLWHVHNPTLGKNVNFPEAFSRILAGGARALLQIHDFAEDGRPAHYADQYRAFAEGTFSDYSRTLYPVAPQIGYAVLNDRDRGILLSAGIPEERVFLLPNAVSPPVSGIEPGSRAAAGGEPLILYPTRAIRRKNLGELLLLAAVCPGFRFATTLSPQNPLWQEIHTEWVALGRELGLKVAFAAGEERGVRFPDLVRECAAMVTTSVGEGFGLAFLEPWLVDAPLIGRDLPEITRDFQSNGINLDGLYREWPVPLRLFDRNAFRERYRTTRERLYQAYGRQLDRRTAMQGLEERAAAGSLDFGMLDETAQSEVLRAVATAPAKLEPPLDLAARLQDDTAPNARRIEEHYSLPSYGRRLLEIYQILLSADLADRTGADPGRVLDAFLDPGRFRMLMT